MNKILLKPILLLTLLAILFHKAIEDFISSVLVKHLLHYCNSTPINDLLLGLGTLLIGRYYYQLFRRNYFVSTDVTIALIFVSIAYCYYRFFNPLWIYTPFFAYKKVYYLDLIGLVGLLQLILFSRNKLMVAITAHAGEGGFETDTAIRAAGEDLLNYQAYAREVARRLELTRRDAAFALGITGPWGAGKTSFMNLVEVHLTGKNKVVIHFNAWNSQTPEAITEDFFEAFREALSPYHSGLSRQVRLYSKKLVAIDDNPITKLVDAALGLFMGDDSLSSTRQAIGQAIQQLGKPIYIFIDDLDRLDKGELREVIRLIRNTANFPNTIFIVAYDRNYLINAIKELNDYKSEFFLEKIFQEEVSLPHFERQHLETKLMALLKKGVPSELHAEIEQVVYPSPQRTVINGIPDISSFIATIRDCTRFANSFTLNFTPLQGEVVIRDFFLLELIRFKYPSVYALLYQEPLQFLEVKPEHNGSNRYVLKSAQEPDSSRGKIPDKLLIETYLAQHATRLFVPAYQLENIMGIIKSLFEDQYILSSYHRIRSLSIIFPSNYYRYFTYRLLQGDLSEVAFSNTRKKSLDEFKAQIKVWIQQGLPVKLQSRFAEINSYDSQQDYEKVIRAFFFLARQKNEQGQHYGFPNEKTMYEKLLNYQNRVSTLYYGGDAGRLKDFTQSLFLEATHPFLLEAQLIRTILEEPSDHFPLCKPELEAIVVAYFERYLETIPQMDQTAWQLFHCCIEPEWVQMGNQLMNRADHKLPRARAAYRTFSETKDFDGLLKGMIRPDRMNQLVSVDKDFIISVFGNLKAFEGVLLGYENAKSTYREEFINFYTTLKEGGFLPIPFVFKVIPLRFSQK